MRWENKTISFLQAILITLCIVFFITGEANAAGIYDPSLKWHTIETEHFYIHYHEGAEGAAMEAAREAERAYAVLTKQLDHTPRPKVHIVVAGTIDFPNGAARISPYPQIILFPTEPTSDSSLDNCDLWLRMLITHEYSHVLVMDMTHRIPAVLRRVFGYTISMNSLVPGWWREGYAVYEETARTTAGRGRSAYFDMVLRSAILEWRFPSIDRAVDGMIRWPAGESPYIFGAAFYQYLAKKYGEEKLTEFMHRYSGQMIPFRMNAAARHTFGKDFNSLWEEWEGSLMEKYRLQAAAIRAQGIIAGNAITDRGFGIGKPAWTPSSDRIIFYDYGPHAAGSVRTIKPDGKGEKKLFTTNIFGAMNIDSSGERLVYARLIPYKGKPSRRYYFYTDLYLYNLKTKKSKRLTKAERARDPSWSPDGKFVVYVSKTESGTVLKTIEVETGSITEILKPGAGMMLDTPRFSPDGSSIVFSARVSGRGRDIFLIKKDGNTPERLTYHRARDLDPSWNHDGRYILFVSERTGVPNIFAMDVAGRDLFQVTNVLGGAFQPAASPDGKWIAYSGYSSKGYDIWVTPFDRASWRGIGREAPHEADSVVEAAPSVKTKLRPYRPWSSLLPRYLIPNFWYDGVDTSVGFQTGSADPIGRHAWMAGAGWGSASEFISWSAAYAYSRFVPTVGVSAAQYVVSYGEILIEQVSEDSVITLDEDYYELCTRGMFWIEDTFAVKKLPLRVSLAYKWQERDNWTDLTPATIEEILAKGTFSGMELRLEVNAATKYRYSISPEKGFRLKLGFEWLDEGLGSDYNQRILTGDLRVFVSNPLFRHHVLAMRAAGGIMEGDKLFQGTFRVGGAVGESILSAPGNKFFMLRGYSVSQFVGDRAAVFSGEYRFPIGYPERGWRMVPLFLQKVHAAIFADYGGAFGREENYPFVSKYTGEQMTLTLPIKEDWNLGAGAELKLTGFIGWGLIGQALTFRIGYADDVTGDGLGSTLYLELGTSY